MIAERMTTIEEIIRDTGNDRTRLLDVLQAVRQNYGFVSNDALQAIAVGLRMPAVEVEDTLSFYAFLNRTPKGRFQIRLSKTPVSLMKGAADVAYAFCAATGAPLGGTSPDNQFTVEWTSDIGMADQEPSALIDKDAHARAILRTALEAAAFTVGEAANQQEGA